MSASSLQRDSARGDALVGAASGLAAYVVGYVLTFVLIRGEARRTFGDVVPVWKSVTWFYYNAHFVDLLASGSVGPFDGTDAVSLIAESGASTATFLYAVPPLVLLAAGLGAAIRVAADDPARGARTGAATVAGYGVPAAALAVASKHAVSGTVFGVQFSETVRVALVPAVVVAGLLYPAVFGTAGAVVRTEL